MADEERIAVLDPNGNPSTIAVAQLQEAVARGYTLEGNQAYGERRQQAEFGNSPITAGVEGAARGLTLGGSDILLGQFGEGTAQRKQRNPLAALLGEGASLAVPIGAAGLVGKAGRAVEGALAGTDAMRALEAGGTASRLLGGAASLGARAGTEGAIFGAGSGISDVALSDDPMNAEAIAAKLGGNMLFGGLVGSGAGVALSGLGSLAKAAAVRTRNAASRWADGVAEEAAKAPVPAAYTPERMANIDALFDTSEAQAAAQTAPRFGNQKAWNDAAYDLGAGNTDAVRQRIEKELGSAYGIELRRPDGLKFVDDLAGSEGQAVNGFADWDGGIRMSSGLKQELTTALTDLGHGRVNQQQQAGLQTFFHELLHHHTPYVEAAYAGPGAVIEEVATEVGARRLMADLGAKPVPFGAYDPSIRAVTEAVADGAGMEPAEAVKRIEQASLAMKGKGVPIAQTPEQHVENFIDNLGLSEDAWQAVRKKLVGLDLLDLERRGAGSFVVPEAPGAAKGAKAAKAAKPEKPVGEQLVDAVKSKAFSMGSAAIGGAAGHLIGGPLGALTGAVVGAGLGMLRKRLASSSAEFAAELSSKLDAVIGGAERVAPTVGQKVALGLSFGARSIEDGQDRDARHKQALDVITAASNPQAAQQQVHDGLTGVRMVDPVLADQLEKQAMNRLQYLGSVAPKDPGLGAPGQDRWSPTDAEMAKFARLVAVTEQPMRLLDHLGSDTLTPQVVEAVKAVYPEVYKRLQQQVLEKLVQPTKTVLTTARKLGLAMLTDSPIDSRLKPEYMAAQQQRYAAMRAEAEQAKGQKGTPPRHGSASDAQLTATQSSGL